MVKKKKAKKNVSHTSASDAGRTLANFRHKNPKRRGVRSGSFLTKSKRPGSSTKKNRKRSRK